MWYATAMLGLLCATALLAGPADAPREVSLRPAPVSEHQVRVDLRALEAIRPSTGPGIALMVIGSLGTIIGGGAFFAGTDEALRYGSAGAVAGVGLFLAGLWWLVLSSTERRLIDLELYSLRKELTNIRTARSRVEAASTPLVPMP